MSALAPCTDRPPGDLPLDALFTKFYRSSYAPVFARALMITKDHHEAEEAAQEAFTTMLRELQRRPEMSSWDEARLRGYVIRVMINEVRDAGRRRNVWRRIETKLRGGHQDQITHVESDVLDRDMYQRLGDLPRVQRIVATLLLDGLSTAQIAQVLGTSPSTVRTHVERVRRRLASDLRDEDVAPGALKGGLPCPATIQT